MFGKPKRVSQPRKPIEAKDIVKRADQALILEVKEGRVNIHVLKGISYRYQVKGILKEALDNYIVNPLINGLINLGQQLLPRVGVKNGKENKDKEDNKKKEAK